jgi:hypothetical protein
VRLERKERSDQAEIERLLEQATKQWEKLDLHLAALKEPGSSPICAACGRGKAGDRLKNKDGHWALALVTNLGFSALLNKEARSV